MTFDMEATFSDDYPYFYEESIDDEHSDADTAEILGLLELPPGPGSSTRPAATAGSPAGWRPPAWTVTGVDLTPAYIEQARRTAPAPRFATSWGTSATCRSRGPTTPSCAG